MFELDKYLSKRFNLQHYNCWHFVRDVWFELTGDMLYDYTPRPATKVDMELAADDARHLFNMVAPVCAQYSILPVIVLMKRGRDVPHIGVMYEGKVLHLRPEGAAYQPLDVASVGFDKVLFYTTKFKS